MNEEGSFPRLLELVQHQKPDDSDHGAGLHRLLMNLLYEMSRIQRVKVEDLGELQLNFCTWTPSRVDGVDGILDVLELWLIPGESILGCAVLVEDDFVKYLFDIIEGLSNDGPQSHPK